MPQKWYTPILIFASLSLSCDWQLPLVCQPLPGERKRMSHGVRKREQHSPSIRHPITCRTLPMVVYFSPGKIITICNSVIIDLPNLFNSQCYSFLRLNICIC